MAIDEGCERVIESKWSNDAISSNPLKRVQDLLKSCSCALTRWSSQKFGDSDKDIGAKTKRIKNLQKMMKVLTM